MTTSSAASNLLWGIAVHIEKALSTTASMTVPGDPYDSREVAINII